MAKKEAPSALGKTSCVGTPGPGQGLAHSHCPRAEGEKDEGGRRRKTMLLLMGMWIPTFGTLISLPHESYNSESSFRMLKHILIFFLKPIYRSILRTSVALTMGGRDIIKHY